MDGTVPPRRDQKRRSEMNIFEAVGFFLRRGSQERKKPSKGTTWKKLLDSIRPMNLQSAPEIENNEAEFKASEQAEVRKERPRRPSSVASSSRYHSVENLQELAGEEDEDEECWFDGGDIMIDSKAEQFISQFYHQMRLQNQAIAK